MRLVWLALAVLIAGCLGNFDSTEGPPRAASSDAKPGVPTSPAESEAPEHSTPPASHVNATPPGPPPPMRWEGSVTFGMESGGHYATCRGPFHSCDMRPFSITATFDVTATLSWGLATNDLDLYLYRDTGAADEFVGNGDINGSSEPASTHQQLHHADLPPGHYRLYVVPRHAVYDAYELDAVFS